MIVRLLPSAEADLEDIGDFIARDNPRRAVTFVRELRGACLALGSMPYAFPLVPFDHTSDIRHRGHGKYQIFYRIEGRPERVDVLHILHGARNYAAILLG